jgi:hypothetical protein
MTLNAVWHPTEGTPELLVDLSNVLRDDRLGGPADSAAWSRLDVLADAWERWPSKFDRPHVRLVADSSLRQQLSSEDRRRLKDAEAAGWAETHDYADEPLLDLAESAGCLVLTRDQFLGHRRQRPWIETSNQFLTWHVDEAVTLEAADLAGRTGYSLSRAEEADDLKAHHLRPDTSKGAALLTGVYRCENESCVRRAFTPAGADVAPFAGPRGEALCAGCKQALSLVGRRSEVAVVRLSAASDPKWTERIPLAAGGALVLGRASSSLSLKSMLSDDALRRISREHLSLAFNGRRLVALDLSSTNGTTVQVWDWTGRQHGAASPLPPHHALTVGPRDRLILGGALVVERSGRRYPFDLAPVAAAGSGAAPMTAHAN